MMRWIRKFEALARQLLEGRLGSLLGASTQPVDLARRLAEHMEDQRTVGAGRTYVPNRFRIYLNPETLARFASFESGLEDELSAYLIAKAKESELHFVGRVRVTMLADPEVRSDRMRVESDLVDRRGVVLSDGQDRTQAIAVPSIGSPPERPDLVLEIGARRLSLDTLDSLSLGRALDNGLILDASSVSRHHARMALQGEHWSVEDLGSTHGTFVNGHRVSSSVLRPGDRIQLGDQVIRLIAVDAEPGEPAARGNPAGPAK